MNLLDILDKLNKAINRRKNIHTQLKNINNNIIVSKKTLA